MAQPIPRSQDTLKKDETVNLIAASKVNGTKLYNRVHKHVGELEEIMIDKVSGHVAYAVVAFGGFLGLGETRRAIPWSVLHYDTSRDKKPRTDQAARQPELTLRPGMIFTIEPMINAGDWDAGGWKVKLNKKDGWTVITRDGQLSAQFEHTVGVTEDGCEVFTISPAGLHHPAW